MHVKLNLLPLKKLYVYDTGLLMYKYDNDILPELYADIFTPVCNIHNHDIRKPARYHLYVDFQGITYSQKCIKHLEPHVWNFTLAINTTTGNALNLAKWHEVYAICRQLRLIEWVYVSLS